MPKSAGFHDSASDLNHADLQAKPPQPTKPQSLLHTREVAGSKPAAPIAGSAAGLSALPEPQHDAGMPWPSTLVVLNRVGLVEGQRRGREVRYSVRPERLDAASEAMARVAAQWDRRLARIKRLAESVQAETKPDL